MNIYELISRAQGLRQETKLDSVSPDRVGALCEDTLKYINEFQLLASSPSLHKIYVSVSAMQADAAPKSDLTGKALKPGQLVVIVPANQSDATAGDVYRYDGPSGNTSAWTFISKIGAVPADAELSATSENPVQNKVVTEKLTELSAEVSGLSEEINGNAVNDSIAIPFTQGEGMHPRDRFPINLHAGELYVRIVDDGGVFSSKNIDLYLYDKDGNALLSGSNVSTTFARRTISANATHFGVFVSSSNVVASGNVYLEVTQSATEGGLKGENRIPVLREFEGFVFSKNDGSLLSGSQGMGYLARYINLEGIDYISYQGSATGNIAAIVFYDKEKNFLSAITGTSAAEELIVKEFPTDAQYVRFSFPSLTTAVYIRKFITNLDNRISAFEDVMGECDIKTLPIEVSVDNSYVNFNSGKVLAASSMSISQDIEVKAGTRLLINAKSTGNAAVVSKKVNGNYIPLCQGTTSALQNEVVITEDCTIVLSVNKSSLGVNAVQIATNDLLSKSFAEKTPINEESERVVVLPKTKKWRCVCDFTIKVNANKDADAIIIAKCGSNDIKLKRSKPSLLYTKYADNESSYVQEVNYNSGFILGNKEYVRNMRKYKALVGEPVLSIWLKGYNPSSEPSVNEVEARAQWLEENQDYALVVENDTLSIIRDGVGYNGNAFNGGATTTIFSTTLGANKTLASLYNELLALDYLQVEMMNFDPSLGCTALLQFGKVKLVGRYNQQLDRKSSAKQYACDSYPVMLRYEVDKSTHTLEMLCDGENTYCAVDGLFSKFVGASECVIFPKSNDVEIKGIELIDNISNVVIRDEFIETDRTPRIVGLMGHSIKDTYESGGLVNDSVTASVTRVGKICSLLAEKGYSVMSLDDVNYAMSMRMSNIKNRSAFFVFDDVRIKGIYNNYKTRSHISRYGYPMNFAIIQDSSEFTQAEKNNVIPMRLNGWCCASHSLLHDVALPNKNSVILRWELDEIKKRCDTYGMIPNVLVYNWSGDWEPLYNMLQLCGYVAAINSGGDYTNAATNPYNMGRINIADYTSYDAIKKVLD